MIIKTPQDGADFRAAPASPEAQDFINPMLAREARRRARKARSYVGIILAAALAMAVALRMWGTPGNVLASQSLSDEIMFVALGAFAFLALAYASKETYETPATTDGARPKASGQTWAVELQGGSSPRWPVLTHQFHAALRIVAEAKQGSSSARITVTVPFDAGHDEIRQLLDLGAMVILSPSNDPDASQV